GTSNPKPHWNHIVSLWFRRLYNRVLQRNTNVGTGTLRRASGAPAAVSFRGDMAVGLHVHVNELERGSCRLQHPPALEPVVGALHLAEWDGGGITDHDPSLANIAWLKRADLWIARLVVVDEIPEISALVRIDAAHRLAHGAIERRVGLA